MPGPGEYLADVTEGITSVEDLPRARIITRSRNYKRYPCPRCGTSAYRVRCVQRQLHDVGDLVAGRPHELLLTYSQHYCPCCSQYFNADMSDVASPGSHYTHRVVALAVRLGQGDRHDPLPPGVATRAELPHLRAVGARAARWLRLRGPARVPARRRRVDALVSHQALLTSLCRIKRRSDITDSNGDVVTTMTDLGQLEALGVRLPHVKTWEELLGNGTARHSRGRK